MGLNGQVLKFQFFIVCLCLHSLLAADWNAEFDEHTNQLIQELPQLQNEDYLQNHHYFMQARQKLLKNGDLRARLSSADASDKFMIQMDHLDLMLKKRKRDRIQDLFAWEMSYLLGSNVYFLPSFPLEMGGKKVILQRLEVFELEPSVAGGSSFTRDQFKKKVRKISLETFWKAHLHAYLVGMYDLTARNIGVNSKGNIRFFDNESCFHYSNAVEKFRGGFKMDYKCQSFDWPQFVAPLDKQTVRKIRSFIRDLAGCEKKMHTYLLHRYPDFSLEFSEAELGQRLENIRNFQVDEGTTFRDFFGFLYPQMSPGFEELVQIVQSLLGPHVGYGTALWFMYRWVDTHPLSSQDKQKLKRWVRSYVD